MFQTKLVEKIKTHFVFRNFFFENRAIYEIMWKNIVQRCRPQMTIWRMRIACWIPMARHKHTHTLKLCNTRCFYTAAMVARTRLNITLYVHCQSCVKYIGTRTLLYSKRTIPYNTIQ